MNKVLIKDVRATKTRSWLTAETLISAYADLKSQEELLNAQKEELRCAASDLLKREGVDKIDAGNGSINAIVRTAYSWTLDSVKALYPKTWAEYVKANDSLLKEKMKEDTRLVREADIKTTDVITFYPKAV